MRLRFSCDGGVIRHLLLILLFLLAQSAALAHPLSHLDGAHEGDASEPGCEWCVAYAPLAGAAPCHAAPAVPVVPQAPAELCLPVSPIYLAQRLAYSSQAPPALS